MSDTRSAFLALKILVVDDAFSARRILKGLLSHIGFSNVNVCSTGAQALDLIKSGQVEMVIADLNLEDMKGTEILKEVRACENTRNIPFLIITSDTTKEELVEAFQAGLSDYLLKPFDAQTLEEKLRSVLAVS